MGGFRISGSGVFTGELLGWLVFWVAFLVGLRWAVLGIYRGVRGLISGLWSRIVVLWILMRAVVSAWGVWFTVVFQGSYPEIPVMGILVVGIVTGVGIARVVRRRDLQGCGVGWVAGESSRVHNLACRGWIY